MLLKELKTTLLHALVNQTGPDDPGLAALREASLEQVRTLDFPGKRDEEWRYTKLDRILERAREPSTGAGLAASAEALYPDALTIEFLNGNPQLPASGPPALPEGVQLLPLAAAVADMPGKLRPLLEQNATDTSLLQAMATASLDRGWVLLVPPGIDMPILHFRYNSDGTAEDWVHTQNFCQVGTNSRLTLIEQFHPATPHPIQNRITRIQVGEDAHVDRLQIFHAGETSRHFHTTLCQQARASEFSNSSLLLHAGLIRDNVETILTGPRTSTSLNGLYIGGQDQQVDTRTFIHHAVPDGISQQRYHGILAGNGRGIFNGRVLVERDAQRVDARQLNRNLLLSPDARVDTKPQLEIFADDVQCAHGATVGQLDDDALFYLRSRGIGEQTARHLLTEGFATEILGELPSQLQSKGLETMTRDALGRILRVR